MYLRYAAFSPDLVIDERVCYRNSTFSALKLIIENKSVKENSDLTRDVSDVL